MKEKDAPVLDSADGHASNKRAPLWRRPVAFVADVIRQRGVNTRAIVAVMAAQMVIVLLGLVREMAYSRALGSGLAMDGFRVAMRIPRMVGDMGALAIVAGLVPAYMSLGTTASMAAARQASLRWLRWLIVVGAALCLALGLAAPTLVAWMAPGLENRHVALASTWLVIGCPFLVGRWVGAWAKGVLNCHRFFVVPTLAPGLVCVGVIVFAFLAPLEGYGLIYGLLAGVVGAAFVQLGVVGWTLARHRLPAAPEPVAQAEAYRVPWSGTVQMLAYWGLGYSLIFIDQAMASKMAPGTISCIDYALNVAAAGVNVIGMPICTVTLAVAAGYISRRDYRCLDAFARRGILAAGVLMSTLALLLVLFGGTAVSLLLANKNFGPAAQDLTTDFLTIFAIGYVFKAMNGVLVHLLVAFRDTRFLVALAIGKVALKVGANVALVACFGRHGLPLAYGVVFVSTSGVLLLRFRWVLTSSRQMAEQGDLA